jgi:O-antigen ligase
VVAFATYTYVQAYVFRGQSKAVFLSLSGRTEIWPQVWSAFTTSPIVGHGYYAGHRFLAINDLAVVSSVDNTYLEVLVDLGIVGLVIILLSLLFSCGALYACRPSVLDSATANRWRPTWLLMVSALFLVGVRSLTGPTFQVLHPNLLIFLSIAVCGTSAIRIMSRAPDTNGDGYEMSGETP